MWSLLKKYCKLKKEVQKYKHLSHHDPLTGVYNRRKLEEDIKIKKQIQKSTHELYIVVFIDIDNFKHFNDCFGHAFGDQILKTTTQALKKTVRYYDDIYRRGGDEFVLILRHITLQQTERFIRRLEKKIEKHSISISNGYCSLEKGLDYADKLMYKKRGGKNGK